MALQKKENILFVATLMTIVATLPVVNLENIDCKGKAFYCVNSTHFKICVDLGGGVSKTVDDYLIPCPVNTACKDDNYFECEYQLTTTLAPIRLSDVTNAVVKASINTLENFEASTSYPESNLNKLEKLRTEQNLDTTTTELRSTVIPIDIVNGSFTFWDITTELVSLNGASDFINTSSSDFKSESVAVSSTQDLSFGSSTKIDDLSTTSEKVILINNVAIENVSSSQDNLPQTENYVTELYNLPVSSNNSYVVNKTNYEIGDLDVANISFTFETSTLSTISEIYDNVYHIENTADVIVSDNLNTKNTEVPSTTTSSLLEPVITTDTNYINTERITSLSTESSNLAITDFESKSSSVVTIESTTNFHEIDFSKQINTEKYVDHQVIFNSTDIPKLVTTLGVNSLDSEQTSTINIEDSSIAQTDKTLQSSSNKTLNDKITTEFHKDDIPALVNTEKLYPSSYTRVIDQAFTVDMSSTDTEQTPTNSESIDFKSHPSSIRPHIDDMTTDVYKKEDLFTAVITEKYIKKAQPESTTTSNFFELISITDSNGLDIDKINILNNLASTLAPVDFETQQSVENHVIEYSTTDIYKIEDVSTAKTNSFDTGSTPILNNLDSSTYFGESSTNIYKVDPSTKLFETNNTTTKNTTKTSDTAINLVEPLPFNDLPTILVAEAFENINPEIHNTIERVTFQEEVKNNSETGSNQTFLQSAENILAHAIFEQSSRGVNLTHVRDGLKLWERNISLYSKYNSSKNATIELNASPNSLLKNGSLNITHIDLPTRKSEMENVKQEILIEFSTDNPLTSNTSLGNESETIQISVKKIDSNYSSLSDTLPIISEIPTEINLLEIINNTDSGNKLANNITKIEPVHENINETSIFQSTTQEKLPILSTVTETYVTTVNLDIFYNGSFTLKPSTVIEKSENSAKGTVLPLLENENVKKIPLYKMNVIPARDVTDFVVTTTEFNNKEEQTTTNTENIERVNVSQNDLNMTVKIKTPSHNQEIKNLGNTVSFSILNGSENVHLISDQLFYNNLSGTNNVNVPRENITTTTTANSASLNLSSSLSENTLDQIIVQNYTNEYIIYKEYLNNLTERAVTNYDSDSLPKNKKDLISNKNVVESINTKNNQPTIKSIVHALNTNVSSNKANQPVHTDIFVTQNDIQEIKSKHDDTQANHQDVDSSSNTIKMLNDSATKNNKSNAMVPSFNNGDTKRGLLAITNDKPVENIEITKTIATTSLTDLSKVTIIHTNTNFEYLTTSTMTNLEHNDFNKSNIKQDVKGNLSVNQMSTVNSSSKNNSVSQNISIQKLADINNNKTLIQLLNYTAILQNTPKSKSSLIGSNDSKTYLDVNNKQTIQSSTVKSQSNKTMDNPYPIDMRSKMEFTCANRPRGRYSDENNCNKFYICIGKEEPIFGTCPVDTVFSETNKQCTKNLSHCIRNNQFKCLSSGRFVDILSEEFYYICVWKHDGYVRYKLQCQKGYHLNRENIQCTVNSASLEDSSKNSSDKSTNERKSSELTQSSNTENKFECVKEGKYEFPDDCRKYYVCIKKNKSEFRRKIKNCDSDEVFNNEKRKCVDADSYEC